MTRTALRPCLGLALGAVCALAACDDGDTPPAEAPAGYTIGPPPLADRPLDSLLVGEFAGYGDYDGIGGRAQLMRHRDGTTTVQLYADGLAPMVAYGVHVHVFPCDIAQAGGHYKIDPAIPDVIAENEIWPTMTTNDRGVGTTSLTVAHVARGNAQSVVIHDPMADNTKMACADLRAPGPAWTAAGILAPFAAATEADGSIAGDARLSVDEQGTRIELTVSGLRPDESYSAHLHALPCHVGDGGGHYKIDPTVPDTVAENELWPVVMPDAAGAASATLSSPHRVRASGQSIVIHRKRGDASPKVACATLVRRDYDDVETSGLGVLLPEAIAQGSRLNVEARLVRRLDGTTEGFIGVQNARPGKLYPVHLHAYSCAVEVAGGHYKIDPSVQAPTPDNELWLDFEANANGFGARSATIPVLARPEATAYVVHDPDDGSRLACVELR